MYYYIHWPFCPYRCHFCPFVALAGQDEHMGAYHDTLIQEIESYSSTHAMAPLKTVFFGGGTPSTYPLELLGQTVDLIRKKNGFADNYEMTIEVNPGTVNQEKLEAWKQFGINRLSIGVQSLNDDVLKKLNRHQKAQDVYNLLESASPLFDNLSVDLIVGLPGVSVDDWKAMIEQIVTWPINHVSVYFLTVHEDTQLYFGVAKKAIMLPPDDMVVDLYYWTIEQFARAGIVQYELSNFARAGKQSQHNSAYWQRHPFKGFGLGAFSFDGTTRTQNEKNLTSYMQKVKNNSTLTIFEESLTPKQTWLEKLMLGLRQRKGITLHEIIDSLQANEKEQFLKKAEELVAAQLVTLDEQTLALSSKGLSVANEVIVKLSCI